MPVLFIDPDEVHDFKWGDAVLQYRQASADEALELEQDHNRDDGSLDSVGYNNALLRRYVVGWSGVVDRKGAEIEFTTERLAELLPCMAMLPKHELRFRIEGRVRAANEQGKD